MSKKEITQLFYPEDKNLEHFYKVLKKLRDERLIRSSEEIQTSEEQETPQ